MAKSPYADLPERSYWKTGVSNRTPLNPENFYEPKIALSANDRIVTAGSCFAQHVGRKLREMGWSVLDMERGPSHMSDELAQRYGFRLYSARYGNIYTVRQLLQLYREAIGRFEPASPIWEKDGNFYDSQRPNVEPGGWPDAEAVVASRATHLKRVVKAFKRADVFVFTFGLTEAWMHKESGTVYPTAPGTICGQFDPEEFEFHNFSVPEVYDDFKKFRKLMMRVNPDMKFLVTVSPVPLTATASGDHVEVATCYSKSVLRAVCGMISSEFDNVDYFPSFEIITSQTNRAAFFEPNLRSVSPIGVQTAMGVFAKAFGQQPGSDSANATTAPKKERAEDTSRASEQTETSDDLVCEDLLLEAFAK